MLCFLIVGRQIDNGKEGKREKIFNFQLAKTDKAYVLIPEIPVTIPEAIYIKEITTSQVKKNSELLLVQTTSPTTPDSYSYFFVEQPAVAEPPIFTSLSQGINSPKLNSCWLKHNFFQIDMQNHRIVSLSCFNLKAAPTLQEYPLKQLNKNLKIVDFACDTFNDLLLVLAVDPLAKKSALLTYRHPASMEPHQRLVSVVELEDELTDLFVWTSLGPRQAYLRSAALNLKTQKGSLISLKLGRPELILNPSLATNPGSYQVQYQEEKSDGAGEPRLLWGSSLIYLDAAVQPSLLPAVYQDYRRHLPEPGTVIDLEDLLIIRGPVTGFHLIDAEGLQLIERMSPIAVPKIPEGFQDLLLAYNDFTLVGNKNFVALFFQDKNLAQFACSREDVISAQVLTFDEENPIFAIIFKKYPASIGVLFFFNQYQEKTGWFHEFKELETVKYSSVSLSRVSPTTVYFLGSNPTGELQKQVFGEFEFTASSVQLESMSGDFLCDGKQYPNELAEVVHLKSSSRFLVLISSHSEYDFCIVSKSLKLQNHKTEFQDYFSLLPEEVSAVSLSNFKCFAAEGQKESFTCLLLSRGGHSYLMKYHLDAKASLSKSLVQTIVNVPGYQALDLALTPGFAAMIMEPVASGSGSVLLVVYSLNRQNDPFKMIALETYDDTKCRPTIRFAKLGETENEVLELRSFDSQIKRCTPKYFGLNELKARILSGIRPGSSLKMTTREGDSLILPLSDLFLSTDNSASTATTFICKGLLIVGILVSVGFLAYSLASGYFLELQLRASSYSHEPQVDKQELKASRSLLQAVDSSGFSESDERRDATDCEEVGAFMDSN